MSSQLSKDDARAIARILYAVHQRRAARLAVERDSRTSLPDTRNQVAVGNDTREHDEQT
jgi:hypothetical protein